MPNIPGSVPLGGFIAPSDPGDVYAVQDSLYGRGGHREVADNTARNAITTDRRRHGMTVFTQDSGKTWRLLAAPWNGTDTDWVEVTGGTGGDLNYTHAQGVASTTWTVNHNLGKFPAVTIVDSGGSEVVGAVQHVTSSQLVVTFAYPFSGTAYCN